MCNLKESNANLSEKFETLLSHLNGTDEAIKYLKSYFLRLLIWKCVRFVFLLGSIATAIYLSVNYIPTLNWNSSAIGRLALIKLLLPVYNWQYLYNSRCLIEMSATQQVIRADEQEYYGDDSEDEKCTVCENLGNFRRTKCLNVYQFTFRHVFIYLSVAIDEISNTSFGNLHAAYLVRDHPVIINDSHDEDNIPKDFVEFLQTLPRLKFTIPCNAVTNLLQIRTEQPNLNRLLEQAKRIETKDWFLHFRNCEFDAVKASRAIFPYKHRPYYMSNHLPPFHSSWILLSNQYNILNEKRLPVKDLVFVFQLNGKLIGRLVVRKECTSLCTNLDFQLNAGQALIFNAEMWDLTYQDITSNSKSLAVTFIQEIRTD